MLGCASGDRDRPFPAPFGTGQADGAEVINFEQTDVYDALMTMTGGIGPDAVMDAVGLESHGLYLDNVVDQIKASTFLGTDPTHALRQAIMACRKGVECRCRASTAASSTSSRSAR